MTFSILARIARVERKARGSWFSMILYYNASGQASPPSLSRLLQIQEQIRNQSCKQRQVCYTRSKGMHTKPWNLYRPIKAKQKVCILGSATTATHGGLPCTALVYGGPLYTALIRGPHTRPSCTALFCMAVLHGQIVKPFVGPAF